MQNTQAILKKSNELIVLTLKKVLRDQGHYLSGALDRSLRATITKDTLIGLGAYYLWILEKGVTPGKMVTGAKAVKALTDYVQKRMGYDSKKATRVAFAILKKQHKEGVPTRNAYQYSSTGQRRFALRETFKILNNVLDDQIFNAVDELIDNEFNKQKTQTA